MNSGATVSLGVSVLEIKDSVAGGRPRRCGGRSSRPDPAATSLDSNARLQDSMSRRRRAFETPSAATLDGPARLGIEIQRHLARMRALRDVPALAALHLDPDRDRLLVEDAAFEQERVVLLERVHRARQRQRHRARRAADRLGAHGQILVVRAEAGLPRIDAPAHPVDAGHQHPRERQVDVARRVRRAELDPLRLRRARPFGDANGRAAVREAVDQVHGRLEARDKPLVRVRARVREPEQRRSVMQQPADIVQRRLAQLGPTRSHPRRAASSP